MLQKGVQVRAGNKQARKKIRRKRKGIEDKQREKEGTTYAAGAFGGDSTEAPKRKKLIYS